MRFHLESTSRKSQLNRAIAPVLEKLDERRMLTIVNGGETAYYQNSAEQVVRVIVQGGGSLAFVGTSTNANGTAVLNDVPMTIIGADGVVREHLGGFGGRDGVEPINFVRDPNAIFPDAEMRSVTGGYYGNVPTDEIAYEALATNTAGRTYAMNRRADGGASEDAPAIDVLGVNNNNGRVEVLDSVAGKILSALLAFNPGFEPADLGDLIGADFDLADADTMYFALEVEFPFIANGNVSKKTVPAMFEYNIRSEAVTLNSFFGAQTSQNNEFEVFDFTFINNNQVAIFGSAKRGDNDPEIGLYFSNKNNVVLNSTTLEEIVLGAGDNAEIVEEINAMESIDGTFIIASVGDELLRIQLNGTNVVGVLNSGSSVDPDEPENADNKRGAAIGDLSYNSRLVDNFFQVGKRGVLLGTDVETDELLGIDVRQRFTATDVFQVVSAEATADTSLAMTVVTPDPNTNLPFVTRLIRGISSPYAASAGSVATLMGDPGQDLPVIMGLGGGTGGVYIGARSKDINDQLVLPTLTYDLEADPDSYVGTLPGVKLPKTITSGIYINGSINDVFIAGTIVGRVSIQGSVDTFYAGNILTGDLWQGTNSNTVDNFFVGGDLRNLVVQGGIGKLAGSPNAFEPRTDFAIGGRVHQIKAAGEIRGAIDVVGKTNNLSYRGVVTELETVVRATGNNVANAFNSFQIANQTSTRNDGFDQPQIIGSIASDNKGRGGSYTVLGSVNNGAPVGDNVDTYGLPLLAGEGAIITLSMPLINDVHLEVVDASGRVYYTNQSNQNFTREDRLLLSDDGLTFNLAVNVTAKTPGLWRVRVVATNPDLLQDRYRLYQLSFTQIGAIGLGGVMSNASVVLSNATTGIKVRNGDLGGIFAGNELYGANAFSLTSGRDSSFLNPIITQNGNIRAIEAGSISHLENGVLSGYPFIVSSGKIGMIHADDRLYINDAAFAVNLGTNGLPSQNIINGGDIQVVEAGGNFSGVLATKGSIGVIRAGSIDANTLGITRASYFLIDADAKGADELGLIDSLGDIGNFDEGGPSLRAGNSSNIRYMRAGGQIYRDRFFGFGSTIVETATNASITVNDDTGAEVSVKPITRLNTVLGSTGTDTTTGGGGTDTTPGGSSNGLPDPFGGNGGSRFPTYPNPFGSGGTGGVGGLPDPFGGDIPVITDPDDPDAGVPDDSVVEGDLRLETYPVRSGGFIITSVQSSTGVSIATNRQGGGGLADISNITTGDRGTPITLDEDNNLVAVPTEIDPTQPLAQQLADANRFLDVILVGNSRVNVLQIAGSGTGTAQYTRVDNYTDGEIINLNAASTGILTGEWLGVSRSVAGTEIAGLANITDTRFTGVANVYPYNNAKNMIIVTNANTIAARGPMGNITIKQRVQNVIANADNKNVKGVLEGIVAPVLVLTMEESVRGTIDRTEIGEGLAYSGSGEVSLGGIYSTDTLGIITNVNGGGDLRGDVFARRYILGITLTGGGSIIDADIYAAEVGAAANEVLRGPGSIEVVGFEAALESVNIYPDIDVINDTPANPIGVGKITISGNGGMINTRVFGYNIGKVTANKGSFGILTSDFVSQTGGTMGGIAADGLGVRYVSYRGGSFMGDVVATGNGKVRSVDEFSRSVRASENGAFDASTGNSLYSMNDLNLFLGTNKTIRSIPTNTQDGVIEDSLIESNRTIRSVQAFTIRSIRNPREARPRDETYPMQINTGGHLTLTTTKRSIEGLRIVSGTTGTIQSGYDVKNFQLQTTGFVDTISVKRNYLGSSNLNIVGSGSLNQIRVGGNVNGTAYVAKGIRTISVGGNLSSSRNQGGFYTAQTINVIDVKGDILSGAYLAARNVIKSLNIGGDVQAGAQVYAKSIQNKNIQGDVDGIVS